MKVLQINSVCGIRSTGRICTDIADALTAQGHECKIAYGRETVPEKYQKYAVRIGTDIDVRINGVQARLFDNDGFAAKRQTKKLIDFMKAYQPDIVHLHNLHGYYLNIELLFAYLIENQIPTVCTMHDCWAVTGHCSHFTTVKCESWKTGCHDCPQKKSYPASYFLDNSKKNWNKKKELYNAIENVVIVTPSQWLADIMKESYLGDKRIEVIPNGIDTDVFQPTDSDFQKRYGLENKKIVLGVASAWGESKGLGDFISLAEILEDDYKVVLVGLTEQQKADLPENILGITRTNSTAELAEIYSAADVFVNPTYQDNYPTTNLEARSCGTPVITYQTGGSPESAGEDAVVVEVGDVDGLLGAIENMVKEKKHTVVDIKGISNQRMAESYVALCKELSENERGGGIIRTWIVLPVNIVHISIASGIFDEEVPAA